MESFEAVFSTSRPQMLRTAYLIVGSHAVAEEVVQEAFLRLYRRFDTVENPGGYLHTTVVRLCLQTRGRATMEAARLAEAYEPGPTGEPTYDTTWESLARVRPERRVVLVLRFYDDLMPVEIARVLGWRTATVRTRLHRGLADLRKELQR